MGAEVRRPLAAKVGRVRPGGGGVGPASSAPRPLGASRGASFLLVPE